MAIDADARTNADDSEVELVVSSALADAVMENESESALNADRPIQQVD